MATGDSLGSVSNGVVYYPLQSQLACFRMAVSESVYVLHLPTYTLMLTWTSTLMPARHTHTNMHILIHISANIHEQHKYVCVDTRVHMQAHGCCRATTLDDKGVFWVFVHLGVGGDSDGESAS